jgi:hypothetical protein
LSIQLEAEERYGRLRRDRELEAIAAEDAAFAAAAGGLRR